MTLKFGILPELGVLTKCLSFQLVTLLLQSISPLFFSWTILLHVKTTNVTFASWCLRRITSTPIIWHIVGKPYNWLNFIGSKTWKAMEEISWHNSSFPSSVFCYVFPSCVPHFTVYYPFFWFPSLTILTIVANKCEAYIKCVQLLQASCNQFYICRVLLKYIIAVSASA